MQRLLRLSVTMFVGLWSANALLPYLLNHAQSFIKVCTLLYLENGNECVASSEICTLTF
jgi:hypothetical protein